MGNIGAENGQDLLQPAAGGGGTRLWSEGTTSTRLPLSSFARPFRKQALQLGKKIAFDTAYGAVQTHAANSTFFNPGANIYRTIKANR